MTTLTGEGIKLEKIAWNFIKSLINYIIFTFIISHIIYYYFKDNIHPKDDNLPVFNFSAIHYVASLVNINSGTLTALSALLLSLVISVRSEVKGISKQVKYNQKNIEYYKKYTELFLNIVSYVIFLNIVDRIIMNYNPKLTNSNDLYSSIPEGVMIIFFSFLLVLKELIGENPVSLEYKYRGIILGLKNDIQNTALDRESVIDSINSGKIYKKLIKNESKGKPGILIRRLEYIKFKEQMKIWGIGYISCWIILITPILLSVICGDFNSNFLIGMDFSYNSYINVVKNIFSLSMLTALILTGLVAIFYPTRRLKDYGPAFFLWIIVLIMCYYEIFTVLQGLMTGTIVDSLTDIFPMINRDIFITIYVSPIVFIISFICIRRIILWKIGEFLGIYDKFKFKYILQSIKVLDIANIFYLLQQSFNIYQEYLDSLGKNIKANKNYKNLFKFWNEQQELKRNHRLPKEILLRKSIDSVRLDGNYYYSCSYSNKNYLIRIKYNKIYIFYLNGARKLTRRLKRIASGDILYKLENSKKLDKFIIVIESLNEIHKLPFEVNKKMYFDNNEISIFVRFQDSIENFIFKKI